MPIFTDETINLAPNLGEYDSLDEHVIRDYNEFMLASKVYYALKQGATSEQSARMTAMDGASKNAGMYNRFITGIRLLPVNCLPKLNMRCVEVGAHMRETVWKLFKCETFT